MSYDDGYQPPAFDEQASEPWTPAGHGIANGAVNSDFSSHVNSTVGSNVNADLDLDELDPNGRFRRSNARRRRKAGLSRKKKVLKYTALGTAGVVAVVIGVGAYVIAHLDGNIKHTALLPTGVTQSAEIPDKFGNTPMNVLLIGTDARVTAADCKLGGDCSASGNGNSDVLMLIHLAADQLDDHVHTPGYRDDDPGLRH
jgi:hypothetical protein